MIQGVDLAAMAEEQGADRETSREKVAVETRHKIAIKNLKAQESPNDVYINF